MRVVLTVLLLVLAAVTPAVGVGSGHLPATFGGESVTSGSDAATLDAESVAVDGDPATTADELATFGSESPDVSATAGPLTASGVARQTGDAATQATNRTVPNASRVLAFPSGANRNSTIRTTTIDAGGATGIDAVLAGVRMETFAAEARIANATASERPAAVRREVLRLDDTAGELRERQRTIVANYTTGAASARETAVALARIHAVAGELQRRATRLAAIAENATVDDAVENDARRVALDLGSLRGPVRASVLAAARGERPPVRAFVATTEAGVVLTTIDGDTFVREAYLGRLWGDDDTPQSAAESSDVVADSYPEIWAARNASGSGTGFGSTFQFTVEHAGGRLDTFVRNNERVAVARQQIPLAAFPPGPAVERTTSGIRVVLNRTYPGGPMRLTVTDSETGELLDAQVALSVGAQAGELLGRTGSDGQLWTLSPGVGFTITVDAGPGRIAQLSAVSPARPTTVGDAIRSRLQPGPLAAAASDGVGGAAVTDAGGTLAVNDAGDTIDADGAIRGADATDTSDATGNDFDRRFRVRAASPHRVVVRSAAVT